MKVSIIIPYYGNWPLWMPLFLDSCSYNYQYDWILIGDSNIDEELPENVKFYLISLDEVRERILRTIGVIPKKLNAYKLCDYKPAYGLIFEDLLSGSKYWGHGDLDLAYGKLSDFINEKHLPQSDVFSPYDRSCGHFQLYKNNSKTNNLFFEIENLNKYLSMSGTLGLDEPFMDIVLAKKTDIAWSRYDSLEVAYDSDKIGVGATIELNGGLLGQGCENPESISYKWEKGRCFQIEKNGTSKEFLYIHWFMWKDEAVWGRLMEKYKKEKSLKISSDLFEKSNSRSWATFQLGILPNSFIASLPKSLWSNFPEKISSAHKIMWAYRQKAERKAKRLREKKDGIQRIRIGIK